jgi:hypothetical protein
MPVFSSYQLNQNVVDTLGLINAETQQLKAAATRAAESSERLEGQTKALVPHMGCRRVNRRPALRPWQT